MGQNHEDATQEYRDAFSQRERLRHTVYGALSAWDRVQLARHSNRPQGHEAAAALFGELDPVRGDRACGDDDAIVTGIGRWRNQAVAVIGCARGRSQRDARKRNFGMPSPSGFRKVINLLDFAERHQMPVISFVDTPGAYPGVESERQCIAGAISRLLWKQADVNTPTLGVILGEGGSGGALALAMADRMIMMENAYFSVISPEACASILWRDGAKTAVAASSLGLLPEDLLRFGIVDEIVSEPKGGAHRYPVEALCRLREVVDRHLDQLLASGEESDRRQQRYQKFRAYGTYATKTEESP